MKAPKIKKPIPYAFVLDELEDLGPMTRPMFGCTAVYIGDKIVCVLREKDPPDSDNGIWLATTEEHHASLKKDFPKMRSIRVLGDGKKTGWQALPAKSADFEEAALLACRLIRKGDPRIGKIPARKKPRKKTR